MGPDRRYERDDFPPGEYNDLLIPIMSELRTGVTAAALAERLMLWLTEDYGIDPPTAEVAEQMVAWWAKKSEPEAG